METLFTEFIKTGELVTQFPMAGQVLKSYKIDYCCDGDRPIGRAIREKGLDIGQVLGRINELYKATRAVLKVEPNWVEKSYGELIDHVIAVHHAYLNQALPELSELVRKIFRVHGQTHSELSVIYSLFHDMKRRLTSHCILEENIVFPKIKRYEKEPTKEGLVEILDVLTVLEKEHALAGEFLRKLRNVTRNYHPPEDACGTYRLTYAKLEELEIELFEDIHLENNILFPRIEKEQIA